MPRALLALLFACGCAGAGHSYGCDVDAGSCGTIQQPDGGAPFVSDAVMVAHDGAQNSGTDALVFNGSIYAVYRHASSWSIDPTAILDIVRSNDGGKTWIPIATIGGGGFDPRQPKLFAFEGKLWVVATAWNPAAPLDHQTVLRAASSGDGLNFGELGAFGTRVDVAAWRPRAIGSDLFVSVWGADEIFPADLPTGFALLSTADASAFTSALTPSVGPGAREGDLIVRANGERWMAIPEREDGTTEARQTFCHAVTNWTCWSVPGVPIESPALFEWKGALFVAGKRVTGEGFARTSIWEVLEDAQDLSPVGDLPAGFGDTGAPGVVPLDDTHVLVTFHTTSKLDPRVAALASEPSETDAKAAGYATDVLSVTLDMTVAGSH